MLSVLLLFCGHRDKYCESADFSAEIRGITIAETIVSTGYGIAFDAIAGCKSQLHSIIGHKIMITASHDLCEE